MIIIFCEITQILLNFDFTNFFSWIVMPWGPDVYNTVPINNHGHIGLQGYLGLWTLTTLLGISFG